MFSTGAIARKDATYPSSGWLGLGSEVPVFPPIAYPLTAPDWPPPSVTTDCIISRTLDAVSEDMTCLTSSTSILVIAPVSGFSIFVTILGFTNLPLFAMAQAAVIICNGVMVNLWPKDIVANSVGPTLSRVWNWLDDSPAVAIPVLSKKPNALKYLYNVLAPIRLPNWINAGLQEFSNAFLNVWLPWPDVFVQWISLSPTCS